MAGIDKAEVEAAMARIKALQDMLKGGPPPDDEEDDYDPNDPNNQYQETEEDEKWREEQEKEWEKQQVIEKEKAAKEKAEADAAAAAAAAAGPPPATAAASTSTTSAATSSTASSTAAKPASPSTTTASTIPAPLPTGPHQWDTTQLVNWLKEVKAEVRKRGEIFEKKGWTKDELTKWYSELDTSFAAASAKLESSKLTGALIAKWDLTTDAKWGTELGVTNAYHRAAMWACWKEALRKFQK